VDTTGSDIPFSFVTSDFQKLLYGGIADKYDPSSLHFHHPAEHPVDGKHHDVGLHILHYPVDEQLTPDETIRLYVYAVQFSVDNYDTDITQEEISIVSEFFDSLNLGGLT